MVGYRGPRTLAICPCGFGRPPTEIPPPGALKDRGNTERGQSPSRLSAVFFSPLLSLAQFIYPSKNRLGVGIPLCKLGSRETAAFVLFHQASVVNRVAGRSAPLFLRLRITRWRRLRGVEPRCRNSQRIGSASRCGHEAANRFLEAAASTGKGVAVACGPRPTNRE